MSPPEKVYRGVRRCGPKGQVLGVSVTVNGRPLPIEPSVRVWPHNPAGFEWGYRGAGTSQLALALVLDVTGDPEYARDVYQWFCWAVVAMWSDRWEISAARIRDWLVQLEREDRMAAAHAHAQVLDGNGEGGAS